MGAINIKHTGSGSDVTLSSDGTDLLLNGTAIGGSATITVDSKISAYTIVSGDIGKLISFSGGSYTASLTAAATLGNGFYVYIENNAATGQNTHVVTIDPDGSETIDGRTSMLLRQGQRILIVCDGSSWKTVSDFNRAIATNARNDFFNLPQATGDESVAIGLGSIASNFNTTAIGVNSQATGSYSISLGVGCESTAFGAMSAGYNSVSAGSQSVSLGSSYASGADSLAAAIGTNSSSYGATGPNTIAMGYQAKAAGSTNGSISIGYNAETTNREGVAIGSSALASGSAAVALGGYFGTSVQARATGTASFAVAGYNGLANKDTIAEGLSSIAMAGGYAQHNQSVAIGAYAHANVRGKVAWSHYPLINSDGVSQAGDYILTNSTTDATETTLVTDYQWSTPSTNNQVILPNNSVYGFTGTVIAREDSSATDDFAIWEIKGGAVRGANAASTTLGSYNINIISKSAGATNWDIAISADTTNGGIAFKVTGEAAHNIRWVATVRTTEVIY